MNSNDSTDGMAGAGLESPRFQPLTPLTRAEIAFIEQVVWPMPRAEVLARLERDVQTACEIELATIPIYLFSYYSINRTVATGSSLDPVSAFANSAGSQIMSVAVEEMLHMSLSANLFFALFGRSPQLYRKAPASYPAQLPYHKLIGPDGPQGPCDAPVEIPLASFGFEQLWHFLQIENPGRFDLPPKDRDWSTIGQFYSYIRCMLYSPCLGESDFCVGKAELQIQHYNYSPSNVDTVSPKGPFNEWQAPSGADSAAKSAQFANASDSHAGRTALITVSSRLQALQAIDTICDQGEGFNHRKFDDPRHQEYSHYYKFLRLQAQLEGYAGSIEQLAPKPQPPAPLLPTITQAQQAGFVYAFPTNPVTANYPAPLQALSDFCNGLFQYMLIMTEVIFCVPAEPGRVQQQQSQKMYFNIALHRSMIWVLDKYIQEMRKITLADGTAFAPTFEFVNLGLAFDSFTTLTALGQAALASLTNNPLVPSWLASDFTYYIETALTRNSAAGAPKHLPNVADYMPYPFASAPAFPTSIGTQPPGAELHACMGLNSCQGQDRFGLSGPAGPNECAGQGFCSTANDHQCHTENDCRHQGGCGLYGTNEEMSQPGRNACSALGSCATPINAERFITDGEHQRHSVWQRARKVFHEQEWPALRAKNPALPEQLPPVGGSAFVDKNGDVFADGPAYLWISADNTERGNMTACGASGMSGAGGCT
ncbi:MAG: hypothetical protein RL748_3443 [Pseudomonadota bacterium]